MVHRAQCQVQSCKYEMGLRLVKSLATLNLDFGPYLTVSCQLVLSVVERLPAGY
jgi:hypothetical protein